MGTTERLHRPDPERTGPIRNAATYLREPPASDAAHHPADGPDTADGAVAHGVRLGYKVIEEQIQHGRLLAQRLGKAGARTDATGAGDAGLLIERVLHLYKDVGALCVDALEALAQSPAIRAGIARATQAAQAPQASQSSHASHASHSPQASHSSHGNSPGVDGRAESSATKAFAIEVVSARRTQVTLEVRWSAGRFEPRVHALHAADPSLPPLTGLTFDMDPSRPEPMLRVEVPDIQPAGTYTGVVVDTASNEARGTVTVRLLP